MTINGVGYSASKKGNTLVLKLGFSHPLEMVDPEGIETEVPDATTVIVKGSDKAKVGNYAANIRAWRKPEKTRKSQKKRFRNSREAKTLRL